MPIFASINQFLYLIFYRIFITLFSWKYIFLLFCEIKHHLVLNTIAAVREWQIFFYLYYQIKLSQNLSSLIKMH